MAETGESCPAPRSEVLRLYFLEHRAKLLDLASFLDRIDRAPDDLPHGDDFRVEALRRAVRILLEDRPGRARRVLELFSDQSLEPIESAAGLKGAYGAAPSTETTRSAGP